MRRRLAAVVITIAAIAGTTSITVDGQAAPTGAKSSKPARTADGQPDIQGIWRGEVNFPEEVGVELPQMQVGPAGEDCRELRKTEGINSRCAGYNMVYRQDSIAETIAKRTTPRDRRTGLVDPPDGKLPWRPEGLAKRDENFKNLYNPRTLAYVDPMTRCVPYGVPRTRIDRIMQAPGVVQLISEANHQSRIVYLDGRPHVGPNIRLWNGDSIGRWEGQTLVIDTTNFMGGTWYEGLGNPQSDALHVIERLTIVDAHTIDYDVIIDDPKFFSRPWTLATTLNRYTGSDELYEAACMGENRGLDNILFDVLEKDL